VTKIKGAPAVFSGKPAIFGEVQPVIIILRLAPWMSAGWYMDVPLEQDKEDMLHFTENCWRETPKDMRITS